MTKENKKIDIKTKRGLTDEDMVRHIYTYIDGYVDKVINEKYNTDEIVKEVIKKRNKITYEQNDDIDIDNLKDYMLVSKVGEILKAKGQTQTWLCKKTGISNSTMYAIVNNNNSISAENSAKIVKALQMDYDIVFPLVKKNFDK